MICTLGTVKTSIVNILSEYRHLATAIVHALIAVGGQFFFFYHLMDIHIILLLSGGLYSYIIKRG